MPPPSFNCDLRDPNSHHNPDPTSYSNNPDPTSYSNNLDPTSIFVKAPPNYGVVSKSSDNMAFIYTPNADFLGDDSFVYMICGTDWLCSQANVSITVIEEDCCALVFFLLRWLCWIFNLLFGVCLFG